MSFIPDPLISEVLDLLQGEGLEWIYEEVAEAIAAGKAETFIVKQSRSNGKLTFELGPRISPGETDASSEQTRIRLLPFDTAEQAEILLHTLETYTAGTVEIIDMLATRMSELEIPKTEISYTLINDVSEETFNLSDHDAAAIRTILDSIRKLLSDLMGHLELES